MLSRRRRTEHTDQVRSRLYIRTNDRTASTHSSMRYPVESRTQTGPTLPAVDTAFGLIAYARADRADTGCLAHPRAPRAPHGPQSLPGPGDAWRAPAERGTA